jgi:hypothetical protein
MTMKCEIKPGQIVYWRPGTEYEARDVFISGGPHKGQARTLLLQSLVVTDSNIPLTYTTDGRWQYDLSYV